MAKHEKTLGRLEALINKVGGEEGVDRLLRGELKVVEVDPPTFPTWKTITVGTGPRNADEFRKALTDGGCRVSDWGNELLDKVDFSEVTEETELELVLFSVAELGFKYGATRRGIYNKAQELGLSLCSAEVGPQLRLQYAQPKGEWFRIAMEPISDSGGSLKVFYVEHGIDGRWLGGGIGDPDYFWSGNDRFVFVRRK